MSAPRNRFAAVALATLWLGAFAAGAAGAPPADHPSLLEQLNRETEALYREVGQGLLRVQLPTPPRPDDGVVRESPLVKYKELDPKVRRELEQRRPGPTRARPGGEALARANDAGPATRTASDADVRLEANAAVILVPPPADAASPPAQRDAVLGGRLEPASPTAAAFVPDQIGLLLDDEGHVLVPFFVERETAAGRPVRLQAPGGEVMTAGFVGSDRQTNLTVVKLPRLIGTPVRLADEAPRDGSLVVLVAPQDASGRLAMWAGGSRESGVVFSTDGRCAGVARTGQFLSGRACRLIAEQIVRHGQVKRATLGVIITEIRKDDPLRRRAPALGDRSAMRVDQVMPGSAAAHAGIEPGDLLLELAGEAVNDIPSLAAAIASRAGPTEVHVLRGDQALTMTVDLQQK